MTDWSEEGPGHEQDGTPPPSGHSRQSSRTRLSEFLGGQGRMRRTRAGSRGYSRFVRSMKFLLPTAAALLVTLVVAWPQLDWDGEQRDSSDWKVKPEDAENLSMTEPRYVGSDDQNRPFVVTADGAKQIAPKAERVALEHPKGDITLSDGAWVAVTAREGTFDRDTYQLDLSGGVELFHDEGYTLNSESAHVDLRAGTAAGDQPVQGHGPGGAITGQGFRVLKGGDTVMLTGKSTMLIRPDALKQQ